MYFSHKRAQQPQEVEKSGQHRDSDAYSKHREAADTARTEGLGRGLQSLRMAHMQHMCNPLAFNHSDPDLMMIKRVLIKGFHGFPTTAIDTGRGW